jgi:hypothetical protein
VVVALVAVFGAAVVAAAVVVVAAVDAAADVVAAAVVVVGVLVAPQAASKVSNADDPEPATSSRSTARRLSLRSLPAMKELPAFRCTAMIPAPSTIRRDAASWESVNSCLLLVDMRWGRRLARQRQAQATR